MREFSLSQKIVLELLSSAVTVTKPNIDNETLTQADWDTIGLISSHHAVTPMVFDAMAQYKSLIPKEIYSKWYSHILKVLSQNSVVQGAQDELCKLLGNSTDYVILKGLAAAAYYIKPELRGLGDVDFLVDNKNVAETEKRIVDSGYENYLDNGRHITFKKSGKMLELHREIPGVPYGEKGAITQKFVADIFEKANTVLVMGSEFKAPCDMHHGVVLLLHSAHHLVSEGLGLRHLCDWACFVNKTASDEFWQEELLPFLKQIGMYNFAAILTKTCAVYLKTALPVWASKADDSLVDALMEDVLIGGNFGEFDKTRAGSGMMISEHGKGGTKNSKAYNLFRALHTSMYTVYPVLYKAPYLYPFIFVWRIIKYIFMMLAGKRPSLIAASQKADERKRLYDKLKLFED